MIPVVAFPSQHHEYGWQNSVIIDVQVKLFGLAFADGHSGTKITEAEVAPAVGELLVNVVLCDGIGGGSQPCESGTISTRDLG